MKSTLLCATLTLTTILMLSWTSNGQNFSDDSVTISRHEQRQCVKWFNTVHYYIDTILPLKDSIIGIKTNFIIYQEEEIQKRDIRIQKSEEKIKRRTILGAAAGAGIGAIITAFLFGLVK